MDFNNFATAPTGDTPSGKWNDDQIGFLTACLNAKVRISYAGLSLLRRPQATKMRGRHGSSIVGSLPLNLQPIVCRANGGYHDKASTAFKAIEGFEAEDGAYTAQDDDGNTVTGLTAITSWNVIPQGKVQEAFEAFKAQDSE